MSDERRFADSREYRLLVIGVVVSLVGSLAMIILSFMREDSAEVVTQQKAIQASQHLMLIEQAKVVTRVEGIIEEVKKSNRAVENLGKMVVENQAILIAANERSKNNTDRLRELGGTRHP